MIKLCGQDEESLKISVLKQTSVRDTFPMHTHDFYEFFVVTKGRAIHVVNNVPHVVERGSMVFIRPSDVHCYDYYKTNDFEFYNRGFDVDLFDRVNAVFYGAADVLLDRLLPKHIKLDERTLHYIEENLLNLMEMSTVEEREVPLSLIICYVVNKMILSKDFDTNHMPPDWLIAVLDEMSITKNFIIGLPRLLELCNYSQEHINREFKRYLNTTPTRFINELRLNYAFAQLSKTKDEIITICENCGFNNLSHFYAEFKNYYGYSPNKVRKKD